MTAEAPRATLSAMLEDLGADPSREQIAIRDLLEVLGDRALAALLFIFAFPNVLPTPPGTSAILGAPLVFLAAQLAFGRGPWLPAVIANRSLTRASFNALMLRIGPWLNRAERLLRPRITLLAVPPMEYLVGGVCLLLALVLVLPIPLGNALPAVAISLLALGILERDGWWILGGLAAAIFALTVVSGVVFALIKAAFYFMTHVLT